MQDTPNAGHAGAADPQNLPDPSLCDPDGVVQAVGADLEHGLTS